MQYYPLVTGDSSIFLSIQDDETLPNDVNTCSNLSRILNADFDTSRSTLIVNGTALSSNERKFNLSHTRSSNLLTKEINFQYNTSDEGFYVFLLYTNSKNIEYNRCHDYIYNYDLNIRHLSLSIFHFNLRTYSK